MIWQAKSNSTAILCTIIIIAIHLLLFPNYAMSLPILIMGVLIIFFFYFALIGYSKYWINTSVDNIASKLFTHSLIYRFLSVLGMYVLTYYYDPASLPLEIGAADAWNYHISGELVSKAIHNDGSVFEVLSTFWKTENDYGFSVYIGLIYSIVGPYVTIIKLLNGVLGSMSVVRLYQISRMVYDEKTARLCGILSMIFPSLLWFSSMMLKETLLIFFLVNIAFYIIKVTTNPQKGIKYSLWLIVFLTPLYFFRIFLVPLVIICIFIHLAFYRSRTIKNKLGVTVAAIGIIIGSVLVINIFKMQNSFNILAESSTSVFSDELAGAAATRGISYKQAVIAPFILIGAIITPFPSLLHFDDQQVGIYIHFQNELIRNVMYFFLFVGVFFLFKQKNRQATYLFCFSFGYILILTVSGVSFQDRFQVLALPFLLIFMANGILMDYPKKSSQWRLYLFFITIAIISWNLFKLSIRELI
jgi:hypothetical protein